MNSPVPPWPAARLTLRADLNDQFRTWAKSLAGDPADILELLVTAAVPDLGQEAQVASRMVRDFTAGKTLAWTSVDLPRGTDVCIVRMGPIVPEEPDPDDGYARDHRGAEITSTPQEAWNAGRGYWRLGQPGPRHLVITRLGKVLGVYRTDEWTPHGQDRLWASRGWIIDVDKTRLVPVDEDSGRPPRINDEDLLIGRYFTRIALLGYPLDRRGAAVFRVDDGFRRRKTWGSAGQAV